MAGGPWDAAGIASFFARRVATRSMASAMASELDWHRSFEIAQGRAVRFVLGPLELWVQRHPRDWTLTWRRGADAMGADVELEREAGEVPEPGPGVEMTRYLCERTADGIALSARLADRAVASRPEVPIVVQPHQQISLWISTPLWIRIAEIGDEVPLVELPVVRMSDSWAGRDTRSGTLCYATRTRARTSDLVDPHPVRAITRVEVSNRGDSPLPVERINLPVPHLTLYLGPRGWLTSGLRVVREGGGREPSVEVNEAQPQEATRVVPPRQQADGSGLLQGLQALLQ